MPKLLACCLKDQSAATAVELALIAALIAVALLSAAIMLGSMLDASLSRIGSRLAGNAVESAGIRESVEQRWQRKPGAPDPAGAPAAR